MVCCKKKQHEKINKSNEKRRNTFYFFCPSQNTSPAKILIKSYSYIKKRRNSIC